MKFKTAQQGAQDYGRIDTFVDIEALEIACDKYGYNIGRFYMITNSTEYITQSKRDIGTVFTTMFDGAVTKPNSTFHYAGLKGKENVKVQLSNSYTFEWEKIGNRYFLELKIK
ncbi:hypothetical protein [Deferribacter abyssi]|uniref:hypothetical protein n=1 Tax=Deferribacter abyssi TaxID=213806 RepID=UPI003C1BD4CD